MSKKKQNANLAKNIRNADRKSKVLKMYNRKKGIDLSGVMTQEMEDFAQIKNMMKVFSEKTIHEQIKMIEGDVIPQLEKSNIGSSLLVHYKDLLEWLYKISDISYIKDYNISEFLNDDGDVIQDKLAALITVYRDKLLEHEKYSFVDPSIIVGKNAMRRLDYRNYLKFITTMFAYMNSIRITKNSSYFLNKLTLKLVTVTDDVLELIETIEGVDLSDMKMSQSEREIIDKYFEENVHVESDIDENAFDNVDQPTSVEVPVQKNNVVGGDNE